MLAQTVTATVDYGTIADDKLRLQCYDKQNSKQVMAPAISGAAFVSTPAATVTNSNAVEPTAANKSAEDAQRVAAVNEITIAVDLLAAKHAGVGRTLTEMWDLNPKAARPPFELLSYKPIYIQIGNNTNSVNWFPSSASSQNSATVAQSQSHTEAQFQLSFKSKVWGNLINDNGALWFGYSQSSRWQIYNPAASRPFRETNYEPEALLVFRTPYSIAGLEGKMTSLSILHQSNGRSLPLSRSWNRAVMQVGLERDDWMVLVRPWWCLKENSATDDNAGIENYIGRGEIIIAKRLQAKFFPCRRAIAYAAARTHADL